MAATSNELTSTAKTKGTPSVELKLRWGTFCKSISQEPDTKETTVIGVLPALKVAVQVTPEHDINAPLYLPIQLWVHASLVTKTAGPEPVKVNVEVKFSINDQSYTQTFPIEISPAEGSSMINMRVNIPSGVPLRPGKQKLVVALAHEGKKVGEIELPIDVDVMPIDKAKPVKP